MAKFRESDNSPDKSENLAGGKSFDASPKLELLTLLFGSFLKDKYYESSEEQLERLQNIINAIDDDKFIAKAGIYARTEMGMRSITHALIGELVRKVKGEQWVKNAIAEAIFRPDDMLEILAYVGKPIPNNLKKGLKRAVHEFDTYQLSKYQGSGTSMSMIDLFNLVHPEPETEEEEVVFKELMTDELKQEDTWENEMTEAGQEVQDIEDEEVREKQLAEKKKDKWTNLIENDKLGYFATLRNLRNIAQEAPEVLDRALEKLTNEDAIKGTLVMPFRYQTAYDAIQRASINDEDFQKIAEGLEEAMEKSLQNVPEFEGKTLVILDESGSMRGDPIEIGSLFAAVLYKSNEADLMTFSEDAQYKKFRKSKSTMTIAQELQQEAVMAGTNFHKPLKKANKPYDRIIFLSDMQGWLEEGMNTFSLSGATEPPTKDLEEYKKKFDVNPKIYSFDLNGYGDLEFPEPQIYAISGWSERVFDLMEQLESDKKAMINEIDSIEL